MSTINYPFQPGSQAMAPFQQIQQMFPQPQGSVYSINSPLDLGNVPIGSTGLSVALCIPDNLMYIKSFQNGQPIVMAYTISPFQKDEKGAESAPPPPTAPNLETRLDKLEEKLNKLVTGGKFDGLL